MQSLIHARAAGRSLCLWLACTAAFPAMPDTRGYAGVLAPNRDTIAVWHPWNDGEATALDLGAGLYPTRSASRLPDSHPVIL